VFFLAHLRAELRVRLRDAALMALGLALGVGLAVTIDAASTGVSNAEAQVLHSLYGVGTDITITQAPPGSKQGGSFGPASEAQGGDFLSAASSGLLDSAAVATIGRLHGVSQVAGGLTLKDFRLGASPAVAVTVDGVDLAHLGLGPLASGRVSSGRSLGPGDQNSNVALVDSYYAELNDLKVGSMISIANTPFRVIGMVRQTQDGSTVDVYIPLHQAQAMTPSQTGRGDLTGKVNVIYVAAQSASKAPSDNRNLPAFPVRHGDQLELLGQRGERLFGQRPPSCRTNSAAG
jgi:putative ABC transport system permease protein